MKSSPTSLLFVVSIGCRLAGAEIVPATPASLAREVAAANPELRFYEAELEAARASSRAAGRRAAPELSVQLGRQRVHDVTGALAGEGTAWSVSLAQTFEWPGRLALRKAIANRDVALAELGVARFKAALAQRAHALGHALFAAQEKSAAAAEVAERFRALKETFLARDSAGITPLLETRVIEAQEIALQRRGTEPALAQQAALVELNQLRAAPVLTPVQVASAELVFRETPALDALLDAARANHFEFRAKRLELEQQGFVVQLARPERQPSFTVSPFIAREAADGRDTTVGVGISVPLPSGARARPGADAAEARRRQAEAAVQLAQREMEREVIAAAQKFSAKRAEVQRWTGDAVEKFREAAALADRHYRLGAVPLATYVELQTAYLEAVEALVDTRHELLDAALRLQLLTGAELVGPEMKP